MGQAFGSEPITDEPGWISCQQWPFETSFAWVTASEIDELLLRQKRDKGVTILVVTHDVHGARRVGDRFAVLDKGDLIAYGTAAEVENSGRCTARKLITEDYPA